MVTSTGTQNAIFVNSLCGCGEAALSMILSFLIVASCGSQPIAINEGGQFEPKIAEVWKKAGATVGWYGRRGDVPHLFTFSAEKDDLLDALPAFLMGFDAESFKTLEPPSIPFAIVLLRAKSKLDATPDLSDFSRFEHLRSLTLLDLKLARAATPRPLQFKALQRLQAAGCNLTRQDYAEIASIKGLRELDVSRNEMSPEDIEVICRLSELRHLDVGSTNITDHDLKQIAKLKFLKTLNLEYTELSTFDASEGFESLEHLILLATPFTQDSRIINACRLANLRTLNLENTKIDDSFLKGLGSSVLRCERLASTGLFGNGSWDRVEAAARSA